MDDIEKKISSTKFRHISTDLQYFYFSDGTDMFKIGIEWRSRLSFNSSKKIPDSFSWPLMAEKMDIRIRDYFKPYSAFLNYKTYFIVSHLNFITVFDLTNEKDSQCIGSYYFKE